MEVCVPCNTSACQDICNKSGSSTDACNPNHYDSRNFSMSELKTCLTEFLKNEDVDITASSFNQFPGKNGIGNMSREDDHKVFGKMKNCNSASERCFSKSASFPPQGEFTSLVGGSLGEKRGNETTTQVFEANDYVISVTQCYSRSISVSLPTPSKLISAMKGNREKQGMALKKLSVTWAPDVHDPVPTAVSHVPSTKNHHYRSESKKYGKYKQKGGGKSSRSSRSKDKRQARKSGGGTKYRPLHDNSGVVGFGEPEVGIADFNVGSPDAFCGSSFLKKSVTKLHFPVAEAT